MSTKSGRVTKILAVVFTMLFVIAMSSVTAFAATKTVKIKDQSFSTSLPTIKKKASTVKKGTTILKFKGNDGWIKFTAPAKKSYSFTFSNMKSPKSYNNNCFFSAYTKYSNTSISSAYLKTYGGKTSTMWLGVNGYTNSSSDKTYSRLAKRTGKITLAKNQTIYFYGFSISQMNGKLVIK